MRFYEFKNITNESSDLYIYGEIVSDRDEYFGLESDVVLTEFKEELDKLSNIKKLNLYINSPGGSVFVASTMVSMLERFKNNGHKIYAYVDGLSASAASFLMMVANKIYLYKNSMVMIHKPMSIAMGNANDLQKTIDALNKIEDSVMLPLYMNKAKVSEEEIKELVNDETWLSANDMQELFDVNLLGVEHQAAACVSDLFKNYKNTPDCIKNSLEEIEEEVEEEKQEDVEIPEDVEKEDVKQEEVEKEEDLQDKSKMVMAKLELIKSSLKIKKRKGEG